MNRTSIPLMVAVVAAAACTALLVSAVIWDVLDFTQVAAILTAIAGVPLSILTIIEKWLVIEEKLRDRKQKPPYRNLYPYI